MTFSILLYMQCMLGINPRWISKGVAFAWETWKVQISSPMLKSFCTLCNRLLHPEVLEMHSDISETFPCKKRLWSTTETFQRRFKSRRAVFSGWDGVWIVSANVLTISADILVSVYACFNRCKGLLKRKQNIQKDCWH